MADYTTLDEVRAMLPNDIDLDNTEHPDADAVSVWITNTSKACDVALAAGGATVPATGDLAGKMNMLVTREIVYQVMVTRGNLEKDSQISEWHDEFVEELRILSNPETTTVTSTASNPSGGVAVDPWFTRDQV